MQKFQLDPSKIDRLIRPILGQFEHSDDSYQDVHLRILERLPQTEKEIEAIAEEVRKEHKKDYLSRKHRLKSLYEPIGHSGEKTYTFEKILADKEIEKTEEISKEIEPSTKLILNFIVRELVDGKSLNWSILSLLRKYPELLKRHCRKWEAWEDNILKTKYPRGGCIAVALFLNRTVNAIASRASKLRIRKYPKKLPNENPIVQEMKHLKGGWPRNQRRLESQRVREEKLRMKKLKMQ